MGCIEELKSVREEITSKVFFPVSVPLIRAASLHEAVAFCELLQTALKFATFFRIKDGWFYMTEKVMTDCTGLSSYEYRAAVKKLVEKCLIETKFAGLPRRKYYRISATAESIRELISHAAEKAVGERDEKDSSYIEQLHVKYSSYVNASDEDLVFLDRFANNTENPYASPSYNPRHNKS